MHKQSPRSIYAKLSTAPLETHSAKLTLPKTLSRAKHIYGNSLGEYGARGGISPKYITDHFAPYCYELRYAVLDETRMSA